MKDAHGEPGRACKCPAAPPALLQSICCQEELVERQKYCWLPGKLTGPGLGSAGRPRRRLRASARPGMRLWPIWERFRQLRRSPPSRWSGRASTGLFLHGAISGAGCGAGQAPWLCLTPSCGHGEASVPTAVRGRSPPGLAPGRVASVLPCVLWQQPGAGWSRGKNPFLVEQHGPGGRGGEGRALQGCLWHGDGDGDLSRSGLCHQGLATGVEAVGDPPKCPCYPKS